LLELRRVPAKCRARQFFFFVTSKDSRARLPSGRKGEAATACLKSLFSGLAQRRADLGRAFLAQEAGSPLAEIRDTWSNSPKPRTSRGQADAKFDA
jgi:hypothetical protein